ncbi:conjugative transfer protein MobI(A/C) [Thorsellia kenyensis]|uniref:Conjugative transfer protein MobI(A/C) n=1 Tax=Thorsellia kenyensis TaxID=1549888 RepID=A0ABV6CE87_9GAMM
MPQLKDECLFENSKEKVFKDKMRGYERLFLEELNVRIDDEIKWLLSQANYLVNDHLILRYSSLKSDQHDSNIQSNEVMLFVKIAIKKKGFTIEWFLQYFSVKEIKKKALIIPLKMNKKKMSYSFGLTSGVPAWEREHATFIEEKFCLIRKRLNVLLKIHQQLIQKAN